MAKYVLEEEIECDDCEEILKHMRQQFDYERSKKGQFSLLKSNFDTRCYTDSPFYYTLKCIINEIEDICDRLDIPPGISYKLSDIVDEYKDSIYFPLYVAIIQCVCTTPRDDDAYTMNYDYDYDTFVIKKWIEDHPRWAGVYTNTLRKRVK